MQLRSNSKIAIRYLEESETTAWDEFANISPQGTIFASTSYLTSLEVRYRLIVFEINKKIIAGIPLTFSKLGLCTNPLLVKHLGVLYAPDLPAKTTRKAALSIAAECQKYRSFDFNFNPTFTDWLPFYWSGFNQSSRYTYRIIPENLDTWRRLADQRLRNDISYASRAGVTVDRCKTSDNLIRLVKETYSRHKAPIPFKEQRLKDSLTRLLSIDIAQIFEAKTLGGDCIAALCLVGDQRINYLVLSGYTSESPRGTTSLLIATAIDSTLGANRIFDFEGSMIKPIEEFYRGFGGALTSYSQIYNKSTINAVKHATVPIIKHFFNYAR